MRPHKGIWLIVLCFVAAFWSQAAWAAGYVYDDAHLFSASTVDTITQRSEQMLQTVKKEVVVITVPSLTGSLEQGMQPYLGGRPVDGVLIFIDKTNHKTYVQVGNKTAEVFGPAQQQTLKDTINAQFRRNNFDAGILAGLSYIQSTLQARAAAPAYGVPVNRSFAGRAEAPRPASGGGGFMALLFFGLFILVGILIVVAIIRGIFRAISGGGGGMVNNQVGPGYGSPGFGPGAGPGFGPGYGPGYPVQQQSGGGGFWSSLLGGAGGAIAGNALYDHFERRNEGYVGPMNEPAGNAGYVAQPAQPDWQSPDTSMTGSDSGSSWGDSSSSSSTADSGSSWSGDSGSSWDSGGGSSSCAGGNNDWS